VLRHAIASQYREKVNRLFSVKQAAIVKIRSLIDQTAPIHV
jgi:hypothetical protein